jgi:hypothetical protein
MHVILLEASTRSPKKRSLISLFFGLVGCRGIWCCGYRPVGVGYQPFLPGYQPFLPGYQPFGGIYQPFLPRYQPFHAGYQPFLPRYQPFHAGYQPFSRRYQPFVLLPHAKSTRFSAGAYFFYQSSSLAKSSPPTLGGQ